MKNTKQLKILIFFCGALLARVKSETLSWLPSNYSKMIQPSKPMTINVEFYVRQLRQVDDIYQFFELDLDFSLKWTDQRLINENMDDRYS